MTGPHSRTRASGLKAWSWWCPKDQFRDNDLSFLRSKSWNTQTMTVRSYISQLDFLCSEAVMTTRQQYTADIRSVPSQHNIETERSYTLPRTLYIRVMAIVPKEHFINASAAIISKPHHPPRNILTHQTLPDPFLTLPSNFNLQSGTLKIQLYHKISKNKHIQVGHRKASVG